MLEFDIRLAIPSDAEAIAIVHVQAWQETYKNIIDNNYLNNISFEEKLVLRKKILSEQKENEIHLVALVGEKVVGFCDGGKARDVGNKGEIYAIYLLDEYKRQGIGKALFNKIRSYFITHGLTPFIVWVLESNFTAREFYQKLGGTEIAAEMVNIGNDTYKEIAYSFK